MTHHHHRHPGSPTPVLKIHEDLLLALSLIFAEGGEKLASTLGPLLKSCTAFANHYQLDELISATETLAHCTNTDDDEYRLMCYEFNRLFVGPTSPAAPPYESVYLSPDHLVMQEQTLAVRKLYIQEGLQALAQGGEPDDFIATELEFAAYLLRRIKIVQLAKKDVQAFHYENLYHEFWGQHLGRWLGPFAQTVFRSTEHPVFSAISQVLEAINDFHALNTKGDPYETNATQIPWRSGCGCL
ncbi:TorD/DmsD family molecular chaperone [Desulfosporosinus metallidurans]|uniref:Chaperone protein TorD n=1 Tax=Desulfosporosinus metallidurans TaxID=1888891 RepID=A0A1Q8QZ10_9FIRM|nr:molecular chaperone TorD family protein [Desulfosporosinus metallidurans]OLN32545.1 Chaperone protein TorD [Desulfosporosinus metallidurans]